MRGQVPDLGAADFTDHRQLVGAQHVGEQLGEGHLDLADFMFAPAAHFLAQGVVAQLAVELQRRHRDERVERGQRGEQQLDVVDLQGHVRTVADFTLPGYAARQRGVPAHAVQLDVFRELGEEAARSGADHRVVDRAARQQRHAAVVVQEVEAELGFVQRRREPAQRHAVLAVVAGVAVGQAADRVAAPDGDDLAGGGRAVDRGQVGEAVGGGEAGRAVVAGAEEAFRVVDRLRRGAEAQHHVGAARAGEVVGAEIRAGGIDFDFLELEQVHGFQRDVVAQADRAVQHVDRQEGLAQLGAGDAQRREVDRVDDVDAVLDEGAFTPADDLATQADGAGQAAVVGQREVLEHEGVEHAETLADAVLRFFGKVVAAFVLEVVEVRGAHEHAPVAVVQAELGSQLDRAGDGVAFVVLEVAVVTVGRETAHGGDLFRGTRHAAGAGAAARADRDRAQRHVLGAQQRVEPGLGDEVRVLVFDAPGVAIRHRGVEAALELAARELDGLRGRGHKQAERDGGGEAGTSDLPVVCMQFLHGCFPWGSDRRLGGGWNSRAFPLGILIVR